MKSYRLDYLEIQEDNDEFTWLDRIVSNTPHSNYQPVLMFRRGGAYIKGDTLVMANNYDYDYAKESNVEEFISYLDSLPEWDKTNYYLGRDDYSLVDCKGEGTWKIWCKNMRDTSERDAPHAASTPQSRE